MTISPNILQAQALGMSMAERQAQAVNRLYAQQTGLGLAVIGCSYAVKESLREEMQQDINKCLEGWDK